jgi:hypothetical protein
MPDTWRPDQSRLEGGGGSPEGGYTLAELLSPNYLNGGPQDEWGNRGDYLLDPMDLPGSFQRHFGKPIESAITEVAPGYKIRGPVTLDTLNERVDPSLQRRETTDKLEWIPAGAFVFFTGGAAAPLLGESFLGAASTIGRMLSGDSLSPISLIAAGSGALGGFDAGDFAAGADAQDAAMGEMLRDVDTTSATERLASVTSEPREFIEGFEGAAPTQVGAARFDMPELDDPNWSDLARGWERATADSANQGEALRIAGRTNGAGEDFTDGFMRWARANKELAGGALSGLGNAAGAVLKASSDEKMMDKRGAIARDLAAEESAHRIAEQKAKRDANQVPTGPLPFSPTGDNVLRRPDGSVVYARPGIVASAMRR